MSEKTPVRVGTEYAAAERNVVRDMPEDVLRRNVDRLLEQCGRETAHPDSSGRAYLHVKEILFLLGIRDLPLLEDAGVAEWLRRVKSGEVKP